MFLFYVSPSPNDSWIRAETKEIENQPKLRNFNLNLILTCNIYTRLQFFKRLLESDLSSG